MLHLPASSKIITIPGLKNWTVGMVSMLCSLEECLGYKTEQHLALFVAKKYFINYICGFCFDE